MIVRGRKCVLRPGVGIVLLALYCYCASACRSAAPAQVKADLILTNGAVYTMDASRRWAEAVAVAGGTIVWVGDAADTARFRSGSTRVIDLGGRMILPAFQDSHIHLVKGGMELGQCDLNGSKTKEAVFDRIREYAARNPGKDWVVGGGWDLPLFAAANPSKEDLDRLVPDRPACLSAAAAKVFVDGVIESGTAALLEPYLNRPGDRGITNLEPDLLNRLVAALDKDGFQVHLHAIGDRGVRMSLDAIEAARLANGSRDARHHIAHLELINPADIGRFRRLGVAANFQALWAWPDPYITDLTLPALGPARSGRLYPIGSVARTGAVIVGGSDWTVSSLNPLEAVEVGVTRSEPGGPAALPWIPEERADLATMLAAYTINGAYLSREENLRGSIELGKAADLVILDRNLFDGPPARIHTAHVVRVFWMGWRSPWARIPSLKRKFLFLGRRNRCGFSPERCGRFRPGG